MLNIRHPVQPFILFREECGVSPAQQTLANSGVTANVRNVRRRLTDALFRLLMYPVKRSVKGVPGGHYEEPRGTERAELMYRLR